MTIKARSRRQPPVLADPGYGRTWEPELLKMGTARMRWGVALMSRAGTLVGYIAEYDNGWGANSISRGKRSMVNAGRPFGSAQAAADALLTARAGSPLARAHASMRGRR